MSLHVSPWFEVKLAKRTASSSCCSAKLNAAAPGFTCRECGQPCERVLSAPEEVTARG
jgi:hypothetical protein